MLIWAYWSIRGLGQPGRLLLEYAQIPYTDKKYECGPAPEYNRDEWLKEKFNLGLDFPNLPYLIDGEVKITQSNACYRYIARKADLLGKTDVEKTNCDMMAEVVMDFRNLLVRIFYAGGPDFEKQHQTFVKETLPTQLDGFVKYLKNKSWLVGETLTFPDFHFYELLDQVRIIFPGSLDKYTVLQDYLNRFEKLPTIAAYLKSDRYMAAPINNKMAKLGGK
eukprot:TRINITY_DN8555_c0_g1_i1.p1 TRINITY_DN8555_c0_g1~~TRINITY_DN8555_c0_g1_i1.p1  ORF type:complete len:221 (-),score=30.92 TRINITY_DN8555_c0_g1_i1:45-707(-)